MKVVFCTPTVERPYQQFLDSLEASLPLLKRAGIEEGSVFEVGNPYISGARATMTRKALDAGADVIVYLDHDLSWRQIDLLRLIQTEGDVVAGTYRFKQDEEKYMGTLMYDADGLPKARKDGCIQAIEAPAGFLKVTREAIRRFMRAYPQLCYGHVEAPHVDLFNHGAFEGVWWGEDYAFCRNWRACGGELWIVPGLKITHHTPDKAFPGCLHEYLMRLPGGSDDPARLAA